MYLDFVLLGHSYTLLVMSYCAHLLANMVTHRLLGFVFGAKKILLLLWLIIRVSKVYLNNASLRLVIHRC